MHIDTNQMEGYATPKLSISYFWYKEDYISNIFVFFNKLSTKSRGISI